jgi:HK97 family phage portal protein
MRLSVFGDRRASATSETKAALGPTFTAIHGLGRPEWTPRDPISLTQAGYSGNVVGFRCVRLIAETVASIPMRVIEGGAVQEEHPALRLLARPNAAQDAAAFVEAAIGHLQLSGDAYLEVVTREDGAPVELHVLRPDRMRVIPGEDGWPSAYEYRVGRRTRRFDMLRDPQPLLHLRTFHPLDDYYGMSPLEAAAASVDVHNAASRWTKALLDNAARPSGAVVYSGVDGRGRLTDEQYRRLAEELETRHQGAANAGRPMLLEGGLDWKPMGLTPSDMQFLDTKHAAAREIALAMGVPPLLLGLPGDNTHANYAEANRAFYRQTVAPLARRVCAALTYWLGARWGGAAVVSPDLSETPALSEDRAAAWRRVAEADFLDEDEKRRLLGLPPKG